MDHDRLARIERLFHEAKRRPPDERAQFLDEASGGDATLHAEVQALLDTPASAAGFMESPAAEQVGAIADLTGRHLGVYVVGERIGVGGMGEVYRARDTTLGRDVALKVLPPLLANDPERLARFQREARVLAALNHPNIAHIHGLEKVDGVIALVMELVEGPTVADRIAQGPMPVNEALPIAKQIAEALEAAHEQGFVHRDLKPANVKVREDGTVKVLDFGLAKAAEPTGGSSPNLTRSPTITTPAMTEMGMVLGTAAYMSPEQARGRPVDKRADVWAFGCVLYELLTGRQAFKGEDLSTTLADVLRGEPAWDALPHGLSPVLRTYLTRCLEKDPKRRVRDIGDVRLALDGAFDPAVPQAGADAALTRARSSRGARWLASAALVGAGLTAGVGIGGWWPEDALPAVIDFVELTHTGVDGSPSASADGASIAFASMRAGAPAIFAYMSDTADQIRLTYGVDRGPRFFADGQSIAFLRRGEYGEEVWRVGTHGGVATPLLAGLSGLVEADPSPDGRRIAFVRFEMTQANDGSDRLVGILGLAPADGTAEPHNLLSVVGARFVSARWSPDGSEIAVVQRDVDGRTTVVIVDVNDGVESRRFPAGPGRAFVALVWNGDGQTLVVSESDMTQAYAPGAPGRIVLMNARTGETSPLFSQSHLVGLFWNEISNSRIDIAGQGRLVFDQIVTRQTLQERPLSDATVPGRDLTTGTTLDRQPAYSPDGDRVVFTSSRRGNLDLYLAQDGNTYQLTNDPAQDWDPAFTRDGNLIWSSDRGGHLEIWWARLGADAAGRPTLSGYRQLSSDGVDAQNPTATRDGIVVYSSQNPEHPGIFKMRLDGSGTAEVLVPGARKIIPDVSPDGRRALFVESDRYRFRATIRVVEIETGRLEDFSVQLTDTRDELNANITRGRARWASSDRIMFIGQNEDGQVGIFEQAFVPGRETSDTRRPVVLPAPGSSRLAESFDISRDGTHLTVSLGNDTRTVMVADGVPYVRPVE